MSTPKQQGSRMGLIPVRPMAATATRSYTSAAVLFAQRPNTRRSSHAVVPEYKSTV
jgi:hypothetical protein